MLDSSEALVFVINIAGISPLNSNSVTFVIVTVPIIKSTATLAVSFRYVGLATLP